MGRKGLWVTLGHEAVCSVRDKHTDTCTQTEGFPVCAVCCQEQVSNTTNHINASRLVPIISPDRRC